MDQRNYAVAAIAVSIPLLALGWQKLHSRHRPPYPPGPKPQFLIGNTLQFPQSHWTEKFTEWQKDYGDFIYLNVLGNNIIVVNSLDIAKELLVKRGNIYSGRARLPILEEVIDYEWELAMLQPGPAFSEQRTIFRKVLGEREVVRFDPIIHEERDNLVRAVKGNHTDLRERIKDAIGATIIKVAYGGSIYRAHGAALVDLNRELMEILAPAHKFWLVNFIPALHYLPDWLPLPFKRLRAKAVGITRRVRFWAWGETVKHFNQGIAEPSIASQYIDKGERLEVVRDTLAVMYAAGTDNATAVLLTFIANILLHPDVQKRIQEELDSVLEGDTMPTFADRPKLRYLDAAWKESIRLHPASILGAPHRADQDDTYNGMYIPRRTMIITNLGFMFRDPRLWDEPDVYKPERWLSEHNPNAGKLPTIDWLFGFGRRVCPGQSLGDRTIFVFAASLLRMYTVAPLSGETPPKEYHYLDVMTRYPENVRCQFIPRLRG